MGLAIIYSYKSEINDYLSNSMNKIIKEFYGNLELTRLTICIDIIQHHFKCCGEYNYTDWENTNWFDHRSFIELENNTHVPQSCCYDYKRSYNLASIDKIYCTAQSSTSNNDDNYFNEGCFLKLKNFIIINFKWILLTLISFVLLHFLELLSVLVFIDNKIKLIRKSIHPPYVNIEAEYQNETATNYQMDSPLSI